MCTVAAAVIKGCGNNAVEVLVAMKILIASLSFSDVKNLTTIHLFISYSTLSQL
jgi:hypothetical protein